VENVAGFRHRFRVAVCRQYDATAGRAMISEARFG